MARMTASRVGAVLVNGVLPTRRRAAAFAEVLEGSARPSPGEQQAFAAIAAELRSIPAQRTTDMSPEFRDRLRQRLVAVATVQGIGEHPAGHGLNGHGLNGHSVNGHSLDDRHPDAQAPSSPTHTDRRPSGRHRRLTGLKRRAVAGLAAFAIVAGLAGVASASTTALPGETLYGVKRTVESLRLTLATSDLDRGNLELQLAAERLAEVEGLVLEKSGSGGPELPPSSSALVETALADMDESTRSGASRLLDVHEQEGVARPVADLEMFAREQRAHLESLLPELPADVRSDVGASLALLDRLLVRAERMLEPPTGEQSASGGEQCAQPCAPDGAGRSLHTVSPSASPNASVSVPATGVAPPGTGLPDQVEPQPSGGTPSAGGSIDNLLDDLLGGGQSTSGPSPSASSSPASSGLDGLVGKTLSDAGEVVGGTGL